MKAYRVEGVFLMGDRWQPFSKEVIGKDEDEAREKIYSVLGSRHRVKRKMIKIKNVREISMEEIEDPVVKYLMERENGGS